MIDHELLRHDANSMKSYKPVLLPLCLCLAVFAFQCGGGSPSSSNSGGTGNNGGGGGNTGGNSVTLASVSPLVARQNSAGFTLTVNGSGFTAANQVTFNGASEPTTLVSGGQLTAQIPSSAISSTRPTGVPVSVTRASNAPTALTFYIVPAITPSSTAVTAGTVTTGVNIQVPALTPALQLQSIGGCVCSTETTAGSPEIQAAPGQTLNLFIVGNGIVAGTYYIVTGSGVTVTQPVASDFTQTTTPVTPAVNFNITVSAGAAPGPRNLIVTNPAGEISIYPGALVISGS